MYSSEIKLKQIPLNNRDIEALKQFFDNKINLEMLNILSTQVSLSNNEKQYLKIINNSNFNIEIFKKIHIKLRFMKLINEYKNILEYEEILEYEKTFNLNKDKYDDNVFHEIDSITGKFKVKKDKI